MLDFNNFKLINDTYGHDFGDQTLIKFSKMLQDAFQQYNGRIYRLGGDEFAIILKSISKEEIHKIFKEMDNELKNTHKDFGISYGYTLINKDNVNKTNKAENSMSIADKNMYIMKKESKKI